MAQSETTEFPLLHKFGLLDKPQIKIGNKGKVEDCLKVFVDGGFKDLQVITDFDDTLTRFHMNGDRCTTSWGILDNSSCMGSFYRDEARKLFEKYYPIEIDPYMKEEEKIPHIVDWYNQIQTLLKEANLKKTTLEGLVASSNCRLRDRTEEVLSILKENNVPLLVFSAGMGDIVEHVLDHFNINTDNVKLVSNFFKYNEKGVMTGFEGDMIHVFNKNENALHSSDYFKLLEHRKSVLLMGDSLGDRKMASGVPPNSNVLKIGFLNSKIEANLSSYVSAFDIVLMDDQSMDVVKSIISELK